MYRRHNASNNSVCLNIVLFIHVADEGSTPKACVWSNSCKDISDPLFTVVFAFCVVCKDKKLCPAKGEQSFLYWYFI